jgi:hypothetical protein
MSVTRKVCHSLSRTGLLREETAYAPGQTAGSSPPPGVQPRNVG